MENKHLVSGWCPSGSCILFGRFVFHHPHHCRITWVIPQRLFPRELSFSSIPFWFPQFSSDSLAFPFVPLIFPQFPTENSLCSLLIFGIPSVSLHSHYFPTVPYSKFLFIPFWLFDSLSFPYIPFDFPWFSLYVLFLSNILKFKFKIY